VPRNHLHPITEAALARSERTPYRRARAALERNADPVPRKSHRIWYERIRVDPRGRAAAVKARENQMRNAVRCLGLTLTLAPLFTGISPVAAFERVPHPSEAAARVSSAFPAQRPAFACRAASGPASMPAAAGPPPPFRAASQWIPAANPPSGQCAASSGSMRDATDRARSGAGRRT
jgi:hypothetical protein